METKRSSHRGQLEDQIPTVTDVFVSIRMEILPGVGLILIAPFRGNSSVSKVCLPTTPFKLTKLRPTI